jgi:hypothetical protein
MESKQLRAMRKRSKKAVRVKKPVDLPETPNNLSEKAFLCISKFTTSKITKVSAV